MRRLPRLFRTIRWKLAVWAAATMMAAVAVLTVVVVVQLSFADQRVIRRTDVGLPLQLQAASLAPQLAPLLVAGESGGIGPWIESRQRFCPGLWVDFTTPDGRSRQVLVGVSRLAVADASGRIRGVLPSRGVESNALAEVLPAGGVEVVRGALHGRTGQALVARDSSDSPTHVAAPILGDDGELLGALYVEAETGPLAASAAAARAMRMLPGSLIRVGPVAVIVALLLAAGVSRGLLPRLTRLRRASRAWARGDFSRRVDDRGADELGELARSLDRMAGQLGPLLQTRKQLATLEERHRLARELHDTVKQEAFSVTMLLASVETLMDSDPRQAQARLREARRSAEGVTRELVGLIDQLRPELLEHGGLIEALRRYTDHWSRGQGIDVEFAAPQTANTAPVPPQIEQELLRVAQEALTNVGRHSGARRVDVRLSLSDPPSCAEPTRRLRLSVRDDGVGFDVTGPQRSGFGLQSMAARMQGLRGRLRVDSRQGTGTTVVAECPVPAA